MFEGEYVMTFVPMTQVYVCVLCVLLLNVHGQQLRSCWDGQLT